MARQKRRIQGTGSIYFDKKLRKYRGYLTLGYEEDGKPIRKYASGKTRKEVSDKLERMKREFKVELNADPGRITLEQFLELWLEDKVRPPKRARATYNQYRGIVDVHILPTLGKVSLDKLSPHRIQRLIDEKSEGGVTRTTELVYIVLRNALNVAVEWGYIGRNIATLVDTPKAPKSEMRALSMEETQQFLFAAQDDRHYAMYLTLISTGMRLGEALGLKWADIDFYNNLVQIRRSLGWDKQGAYFSNLKTAKSRRAIVMPQVVLDVLKEHRQNQEIHRLDLAEMGLWEDNDLVFCTETGTPLNPSNIRNRSFKPLLQKAGLPREVRIHDLRHTCATQLLASGANAKGIQELLGHSRIGVTLDTYSHVVPSMQHQIAGLMDSILKGPSRDQTVH